MPPPRRVLRRHVEDPRAAATGGRRLDPGHLAGLILVFGMGWGYVCLCCVISLNYIYFGAWSFLCCCVFSYVHFVFGGATPTCFLLKLPVPIHLSPLYLRGYSHSFKRYLYATVPPAPLPSRGGAIICACVISFLMFFFISTVCFFFSEFVEFVPLCRFAVAAAVF